MSGWSILRRGLAVYLVVSVVFGAVLCEVAFRPPRAPLTSRTAAQALLNQPEALLEDVELTSEDGVRLQAWFAKPVESNHDAVILLHGVADNRIGSLGFARLFLSHGYSVLMPDSRGHGNSEGTPSYGIREAIDIRGWYGWLDSKTHPRCIYGFGESMGAAIVLQAARTTPFCAVVAESSFATFREIAYLRVGQMFHTGPWLGETVLRPAVELAFVFGRLSRGVNLAEASPVAAVSASHVPMLLIHGLADNNIPPSQSEILHAASPGSTSLWEVTGAGHCGAASVAQNEFNARVLGWWNSHPAPQTVSANR